MRIKKKDIARDTILRRDELRELGVTKSYEKLESRKESLQSETFTQLDIYTSRKHLSLTIWTYYLSLVDVILKNPTNFCTGRPTDSFSAADRTRTQHIFDSRLNNLLLIKS